MSADRRQLLRSQLDVLGVESIVVTEPTNVLYLTGLHSSNAALLVTRDRVILATDYRYLESARNVDGVDVLEAQRDVVAWLGPRLRQLGTLQVAFEADHLTVNALAALTSDAVQLHPTTGVVTGIRATKEPAELDAIRRAATIVSDAYEALVEHGLIGKTERELAWFLEHTMREAGAEALSFEPIVGAGPHGAIPHHHPGDRRVEPGELVVVDAGAKVDGYCSDFTRTFATGPIQEELERAYAVTRDAQAQALAAIRAGVEGSDVHDLAAKVIKENGFGALQHGLGHGVGLDIHEQPVLRAGVDSTLMRSSVVTVEPGIYLTGLGGVRIEDLVIVTGDGVEILTPYTKELVTVSN
jgi:Xaa-Pro aminopeptidase